MANSFGLKAIISAVDKLSPTLFGIQKNIKITKKSFGDISSAGSNLFKSVGLTGAAIGGGLFVSLKKIVDVSSDFEKFRTILETIEGSSAKAEKAMAWIQDFAIKTPYELEQVTESFVKLKAYGIDPTNGSLASVGDAAAAMGKDVIQGVEALADAMTGENERLKEFGIKASKQGDKIVYSWTENGKTMVATAKANSKEQIEATITGIWNRRYGGAMDKLSGTWSGMVSNMSDQATKLIKGIGDAGIFDTLKNNLKGLLATVDRLEQNGTFRKLAKQISDDLSIAVKQLSDWVSQVDWAQMYEGIKTVVVGIKDFVSAVGGLKTILIALGVVMLAGPVASLIQIGSAVAALIPVLYSLGKAFLLLTVANPIMLAIGIAIGLIARAAYEIYKNWDPIKKWFTDLWSGIKGGAETLWGYLKEFVSWNPITLMSKGWDKLFKLAGGLGGTFTQAITGPDADGGTKPPLRTPSDRSPGARLTAATKTQVAGEMVVKFENAPPGMRASPGKTDSPFFGFNPDVGYRSFVANS
jgi:hypothetical protein